MVAKNNLLRCKYINFHWTEQVLIIVTAICFSYFPNIYPQDAEHEISEQQLFNQDEIYVRDTLKLTRHIINFNIAKFFIQSSCRDIHHLCVEP